MNIFHCDHCGHSCSSNTHCVACGHDVASFPNLGLVGSLNRDPSGDWKSPLPKAAVVPLCRNYTEEQVSRFGQCL